MFWASLLALLACIILQKVGLPLHPRADMPVRCPSSSSALLEGWPGPRSADSSILVAPAGQVVPVNPEDRQQRWVLVETCLRVVGGQHRGKCVCPGWKEGGWG